jgi:hypothetical protein
MVNVVIPVYKLYPSKNDCISITQCCKVLHKYAITLIKPYSLDPSPYFLPGTQFNIESFDDDFFKDVQGYNRLMLSEAFYKQFLHSEYILLHQLDAFVLKDELKTWCEKGYDYIGAPWLDLINPGKTFKEKLRFKRLSREEYRNNIKQPGSILPTDIQFYNRVGNGGFSLRQVKKFHAICKEKKAMIDYYNENNAHHYYNEDVFWSLEVNREKEILKIPDYLTALQFSFEQRPNYALSITNGELPFGCHAWDLFPEFWNPIIRKEGYNI